MNQKPMSPIQILNQKEELFKFNQKQLQHTEYIHKELLKTKLYTNAKTIPASVLSEHKNQIDTFKRNFTQAAASETQSQTVQLTEKPKRDLKEIIEQHAQIQRRRRLSMSPQSEKLKTNKLHRSMSPDLMSLHNKPLQSLVRPIQAMMADRKRASVAKQKML